MLCSMDMNATFSFRFFFRSISFDLLHLHRHRCLLGNVSKCSIHGCCLFFLFGDQQPRLFDLNWQPVCVYVIAIMANRIACMSITPFTFSKYSHRLLVVSLLFLFVCYFFSLKYSVCVCERDRDGGSTMWFSCLNYEVYATNTRY